MSEKVMKSRADLFRTKTRQEIVEEYHQDKQDKQVYRIRKKKKSPEEEKESRKDFVLIIGGFFLFFELLWFFMTYFNPFFFIFNFLIIVSTICTMGIAWQRIESDYEKIRDFDQIKEHLDTINEFQKIEIENEIEELKERISRLERMIE